MLDYEMIVSLPDDNYCEVIIVVNIIHYSPEREKPSAVPGTAAWADDGDSEECEYDIVKGFLRFAPDTKNKEGFTVDLTDEQIQKIVNYYNCEEQIFEQARKYYFDSIEVN